MNDHSNSLSNDLGRGMILSHALDLAGRMIRVCRDEEGFSRIGKSDEFEAAGVTWKLEVECSVEIGLVHIAGEAISNESEEVVQPHPLLPGVGIQMEAHEDGFHFDVPVEWIEHLYESNRLA